MYVVSRFGVEHYFPVQLLHLLPVDLFKKSREKTYFSHNQPWLQASVTRDFNTTTLCRNHVTSLFSVPLIASWPIKDSRTRRVECSTSVILWWLCYCKNSSHWKVNRDWDPRCSVAIHRACCCTTLENLKVHIRRQCGRKCKQTARIIIARTHFSTVLAYLCLTYLLIASISGSRWIFLGAKHWRTEAAFSYCTFGSACSGPGINDNAIDEWRVHLQARMRARN